jgi:hypothetical protein
MFRRITPEQLAAKRAASRAANIDLLLSTTGRAAVMGGATSGRAVAKESPVRSEAYRRLVADMRCIKCGRPGPSQCAHMNYGKGMGIKASDLDTFPMCPDCHRWLDQGVVLFKEERRKIEQRWARDTRAAILAAGAWPKSLPLWKEQA